MATTNPFSHPVFKDGAFTANDRDVRRYALRKTIRKHRPHCRARHAQVYVAWGGREGAESGAAKDVLDAGRGVESGGLSQWRRRNSRHGTLRRPSAAPDGSRRRIPA